MKTKLTSFLVMSSALLLISCSNNDDTQEVSQNEEQNIQLNISHYSSNRINVPEDSSTETTQSILSAEVATNKIQQVDLEHFYGDTSEGQTSFMEYTYDNQNKLIEYVVHTASNTFKHQYSYDENDILSSFILFRGPSPRYFRWVHPTSSKSYLEELTLPASDPNTEMGVRHIAEFDENHNILKAGIDTDFDGEIDNANTYQYVNNNLVSWQRTNGDIFTATFSSILNTHNYLEEQTMGRKNRRLIALPEFALGAESINDYNYSANVTEEESTHSNFELLDNNYYYKKTTVQNIEDGEPYTSTTITEYFFE